MDLRVIGRALGLVLGTMGVALLPPLLVAFQRGEPAGGAFLLSALAAGGLGGALAIPLRRHRTLRLQEAIVAAVGGALVAGAIGAVPLVLSGAVTGLTDACFEAVAGLTTTAATVLADPAQAPRSVLLWRASLQWLGGMAFLVLATTVLPLVGVGVPPLVGGREGGRGVDRLTPRIVETAKLLWGIYLLLTLVQAAALVLCGVGLFDAVCHAFATVSTGGFSTHAGSIGAFQSPAAAAVTGAFMLAAGANFTLHSVLLGGGWRALVRDEELRGYLVLTGATAAVLAGTQLLGSHGRAAPAIGAALFHAVSTVSTTGFALATPDAPAGAALILVVTVTLVGGCAGSTAGGLKVIRALLLLRHARNELRRPLHPRAIYALRHNGAAVPAGVLGTSVAVLLCVAGALVVGSFALALAGLDLGAAVPMAAAALSNAGTIVPGMPGGAAAVPVVGKWVLIFCMLLGRLEFLTVLVLATGDFWRRT